MSRGYFITLEGGEGVGKSTNISFLKDWLKAQGVPVLVTREPGGTPLGEALREMLLSTETENLSVKTEILLMYASRLQHLQHVIEPALRQGTWVLCDRFSDATFAYQGHGRGFDMSKLRDLHHWALSDFTPDHTLLLDAPAAVGMERVSGRGEKRDRFEAEQLIFFERVRAGYLALAKAEPKRFSIIDATQTIPELQSRIVTVIKERFKSNWKQTHA